MERAEHQRWHEFVQFAFLLTIKNAFNQFIFIYFFLLTFEDQQRRQEEAKLKPEDWSKVSGH
jgi:hypothetical protein